MKLQNVDVKSVQDAGRGSAAALIWRQVLVCESEGSKGFRGSVEAAPCCSCPWSRCVFLRRMLGWIPSLGTAKTSSCLEWAVLRSEAGLLKSAAAHLGPRETPFAGTLSGTWHSEAGATALLGPPHSHQQVFTYDRCCTETEEGIQARGGVAKKLSALLAFFCRKTGER